MGFTPTTPGKRLILTLSNRPVLSDIDPDIFGIVCRNLIENALRHGAPHAAVEIDLADDGTLRVAKTARSCRLPDLKG